MLADALNIAALKIPGLPLPAEVTAEWICECSPRDHFKSNWQSEFLPCQAHTCELTRIVFFVLN